MPMRACSFATVLFVVAAWSVLPVHAQDTRSTWADWEQYRQTVEHPSLTIKVEDLVRAKENAAQYGWARKYVESVERSAAAQLGDMSDAWAAGMIEETTPGDGKFTPCPQC